MRVTTVYLVAKIENVWRRIMQSWGSSSIKRMMWNKEFSEGRWNHLAETPGDCVYEYIAKYAQTGDVLDLGCGSGNTGNELEYSSYESYTGVDISDVAIRNAVARSELSGRMAKNIYVQSDIMTYVPEGTYRVILFRESISYVPRWNIKGMLQRYHRYLDDEGVFIVRLYDRHHCRAILEVIRTNFDVREELSPKDLEVAVVVFR